MDFMNKLKTIKCFQGLKRFQDFLYRRSVSKQEKYNERLPTSNQPAIKHMEQRKLISLTMQMILQLNHYR